MLRPNLPSINDEEGAAIPEGLPMVVDAHVHVFPRDIFAAIWQWFDENAWRIRYQLTTAQDLISCCCSRHNPYRCPPVCAQAGNFGRVESVYRRKMPGIPASHYRPGHRVPRRRRRHRILQKAFESGLAGLKLHAHVQCFDMNSDEMNLLYDVCRSNQKPVVMHVGREPKSAAYRCDPYRLCNADKLESLLIDFPGLKVCVPHLGFDELSEYRRLTEKYDTLWLDTTMVLTDYFPLGGASDLGDYRLDRIMYGSDFPSIPYAWTESSSGCVNPSSPVTPWNGYCTKALQTFSS